MSARIRAEIAANVMQVLARLKEYRGECANPVPDYVLRKKYRDLLFAEFDLLQEQVNEPVKRGSDGQEGA